jgi:hypothetical protein
MMFCPDYLMADPTLCDAEALYGPEEEDEEETDEDDE